MCERGPRTTIQVDGKLHLLSWNDVVVARGYYCIESARTKLLGYHRMLYLIPMALFNYVTSLSPKKPSTKLVHYNY